MVSAFQYGELLNQPLLRPNCDEGNAGISVVSPSFLISAIKGGTTVDITWVKRPTEAMQAKTGGGKKDE